MKKLNGFRATHRNKWEFLKHGVLTIQELGLLDFYIDIMAYGKDSDMPGTFKTDFTQFEKDLGYSKGTLHRWHQKLIKVKVIEPTEHSRIFKVKLYDRYLISNKVVSGKANDYQKMEQNKPASVMFSHFDISFESSQKNFPLDESDFQSIEKNFQPGEKTKGQEATATTRSSPVGISSYSVDVITPSYTKDMYEGSVRLTQYEDIKRELSLTTMSIEDMQWLDSNLGLKDC